MATGTDQAVIRGILDIYIRKLEAHRVPISRIYLFGSHAQGTAGPEIDIDIAVFLDNDEVDGFPEERELMSLRRDIDSRIEPHAFSTLDLRETDPFVQDILRREYA